MKPLSERGGVKSPLGLDTEVPADLELTELTFDVLRKAEAHGFARFEVDSGSLRTVEQLADIGAAVGHRLLREDPNEAELIEPGDQPTEGRYLLLCDGALQEATL